MEIGWVFLLFIEIFVSVGASSKWFSFGESLFHRCGNLCFVDCDFLVKFFGSRVCVVCFQRL